MLHQRQPRHPYRLALTLMLAAALTGCFDDPGDTGAAHDAAGAALPDGALPDGQLPDGTLQDGTPPDGPLRPMASPWTGR